MSLRKKPKNNRAIQIQLVKNQQNEDASPEESKILRPETVTLISEQTKTVAKHLAIIGITAYAAVKLIDTLSQIAIKRTPSADNDQED